MTLDYAGGGAARVTMPAGMLEDARLLGLSVSDRMLLFDLTYSRAFAFGWLSEDAVGLLTQP